MQLNYQLCFRNGPFLIIHLIYLSFPKFFHVISERWLHVPIFCSMQDAVMLLNLASVCIPS